MLNGVFDSCCLGCHSIEDIERREDEEEEKVAVAIAATGRRNSWATNPFAEDCSLFQEYSCSCKRACAQVSWEEERRKGVATWFPLALDNWLLL